MKNRNLAILCLLIFAVVLAIVIGQRLSNESMAVLVGVLAGVVASIPTSLLVAWSVLKASHSREEMLMRQAPPSAPHASTPNRADESRIVVVTAPGAPVWNLPNTGVPQNGSHLWANPVAAQQPRRQFTAIGGAVLEDASSSSYSQPSEEYSWQA